MATVVEGDQKVPFSIATTLRCRDGATLFPGLLHFTLDKYLILLSAKQVSIKYHFKSLWYHTTWANGLPNNWRTPYPLDQWTGTADMHLYIYTYFRCLLVGRNRKRKDWEKRRIGDWRRKRWLQSYFRFPSNFKVAKDLFWFEYKMSGLSGILLSDGDDNY